MDWERVGVLYARVALGAAFLSAVASRFGLWDKTLDLKHFTNFIEYTAEVNSFLPRVVIPYVAVAATVCETSLGILLISGLWPRWVSLASAALLATFGTAMAISFGVKSPMDYSVFSASGAAVLLTLYSLHTSGGKTHRYRSAFDQLIGGSMEARLNFAKVAPGIYEAMESLDEYIRKCGLDERLVLLVQLRASQVNGCAYCLDMHWKDLRASGEQEQRLYSLDAWPECPYYTDRERAALAWTEAVTVITLGRVPDTVYDEVRRHFSEKELCDLTLAVAAINTWNRLSISARLVPGGYQSAATRLTPA